MSRTRMRRCRVVISTGLLTIPSLAWAQVDRQRADTYFKEAAALCEREGGRLWGVSLCGPMVFAAAATLVGEGWTVTLAPGWVVVPGSRAGDFQFERKGG